MQAHLKIVEKVRVIFGLFLVILGHSWASLSLFGPFWVIFGPLWIIFGPFRGIFGQICGNFKFFCGFVGVAELTVRMYGTFMIQFNMAWP